MTIDPRIAAAVNGANGEAEAAGTRPCLVNRRNFLLTGGIATTVIMVGIPGLPQAQTPAEPVEGPQQS